VASGDDDDTPVASGDDDETTNANLVKVFGPNNSPKTLHKNVAEAEVEAEAEEGDATE
jgi:hypothetical protein